MFQYLPNTLHGSFLWHNSTWQLAAAVCEQACYVLTVVPASQLAHWHTHSTASSICFRTATLSITLSCKRTQTHHVPGYLTVGSVAADTHLLSSFPPTLGLLLNREVVVCLPSVVSFPAWAVDQDGFVFLSGCDILADLEDSVGVNVWFAEMGSKEVHIFSYCI